MAESKKSFVLYRDYENVFEMLTDEEAGKLIKHIFAYVNNRDTELDDRYLRLAFAPIKQQIIRDQKKYEAICKRNKSNGQNGGRPRNPKKPKKPTGLSGLPKNPNEPDNDNDNDNDNDISINSEGAEDWKKSFDEYKNQVRRAFTETIQDKTWMKKQQEYYPNLNIKKSLEKSCVNFWATEEGWQNKRSKRIKTINWKTTFGKALAMKENHVYNEKFNFNNEKDTVPIIEI